MFRPSSARTSMRILVLLAGVVVMLMLYSKFVKPSVAVATTYCKCYGPADARRYHWTSKDFFFGTEVLPLCKAIESGDAAAIQRILPETINVSEQGKAGVTPIMWAYLFGYYDVVEKLASKGASVDQQLTDDLVSKGTSIYFTGDSVLFMFARYTPQRDRLIRLLNYSDDPNQKDSFGFTVLHYYLGHTMLNNFQGDPEEYASVMAEFVARGVDIDTKTPSGDTPLHLALKVNPMQCIGLLKNGASTELVDADGENFEQRLSEKAAELESKGHDLSPTSTDYQARAIYAVLQYLEETSH